MKLHSIFLRWYFVLLFCMSLLYGSFLYNFVRDLQIDHTKQLLISFLSGMSIDSKANTNIRTLEKAITKMTNSRVTIIDQAGLVIFDTEKPLKTFDNHKTRPEIIDAKHLKFGIDVRESVTLHKEMVYVATKVFVDSKIYYIRLAKNIQNFFEFSDLFLQILIATILCFILLIMITYRISYRINHEIEKIVFFLQSLVRKNFNVQLASSFSVEFSSIAEHLMLVAIKLKKREEKKIQKADKLRALNIQKDDIISAISHEFRNPITSIHGYAETLCSDEKISPAIQKKFLEKILSNANRLDVMIHRLRTAQKLEGKSFEIYKKACDIGKICEKAINNLQHQYPQREMNFEKLYDGTVMADEVFLEIAIMNLIENALKYSQHNVKIIYTHCRLDVIDQGIGIEKRNLKRIFNKFYKVNTNLWDNSMGLGLSIVYNILKVQSFTLQVNSTLGKGSVFSIMFCEQTQKIKPKGV